MVEIRLFKLRVQYVHSSSSLSPFPLFIPPIFASIPDSIGTEIIYYQQQQLLQEPAFLLIEKELEKALTL